MPDQTPSLVKPETPATEPAGDAEKKRTKTSKTEVFEQDQAEKIRFRQVHTQALADRTLEALWDKANVARKDVDKRTILKEYYKLLYARMARIDPSLKKLIDLQALVAEHRLTQSRRPSPAATPASGARRAGSSRNRTRSSEGRVAFPQRIAFASTLLAVRGGKSWRLSTSLTPRFGGSRRNRSPIFWTAARWSSPCRDYGSGTSGVPFSRSGTFRSAGATPAARMLTTRLSVSNQKGAPSDPAKAMMSQPTIDVIQ
jgi:hypothetical protein